MLGNRLLSGGLISFELKVVNQSPELDMNMATSARVLPVVDLAAFFTEEDGEKRAAAVEEIGKACSEIGFFQVVNHGLSVEQLKQGLGAYRAFFDLSHEEKVGCGCFYKTVVGYFKSPDLDKEGNEHFLIFSPELGFNTYPKSLPGFQQVLEEVFPKLSRLASLIESILNQSLGLPENCLKECNNDRKNDFLVGLHYFPATTEREVVGKSGHTDTSIITLLYQDDVGGLEVCNNGEWIQVPPVEGAIIVNVGDVLQVLCNDKFVSATHRVVRPKEKDRYSFAFFYGLSKEKWLEPLPQLTEEIGQVPKFKGFKLKEYAELRMKDRRAPPERYEDLTRITRYAINRDV